MSKKDGKLEDIGTMAAGAAIGGGLGYLAHRHINKKYGETLATASPGLRLKYLVPASAAVGGALVLSKMMRNRARNKRKERREEMNKLSSFQRVWVIESLRGPWT